MNFGKILVVTGTDTEVGKTFLAGKILNQLLFFSNKVGYYKAAQSSDAGQLDDREIISQILNGRSIGSAVVSYSFSDPVSPHLAAKKIGIAIRLHQIRKDLKECITNNDFSILETAGGVIVPLTDKKITYLDVYQEFTRRVILVARAGVGTINHTCLSVDYLAKKGWEIKSIILNLADTLPNQTEIYNCEMIKKMTGNKEIYFMPRESSPDAGIDRQPLRLIAKQKSKLKYNLKPINEKYIVSLFA